jgi:hypothetical protein
MGQFDVAVVVPATATTKLWAQNLDGEAKE